MPWGFGFRGASPSWPYVGRGRGGLPRCWYPGLYGGAQWAYPPYGGYTPYRRGVAPGMIPAAPQMAAQQELDLLKNEAQMIRAELEQIEARMRELEAKEE